MTRLKTLCITLCSKRFRILAACKLEREQKLEEAAGVTSSNFCEFVAGYITVPFHNQYSEENMINIIISWYSSNLHSQSLSV